LLLQLSAFPPSLEVRCRRYDYMDVIGRTVSGTKVEDEVRNPGEGIKVDNIKPFVSLNV
jgi:hypothetical protein